jgi:hypothetical protein
MLTLDGQKVSTSSSNIKDIYFPKSKKNNGGEYQIREIILHPQNDL